MTKEQIKSVQTQLEEMGFIRLSDYYDMSGCSIPLQGSILQFYTPKTKEAIQLCLGDIDDDLMFTEEMRVEAKELEGNYKNV